ncbi:unnamed protein product, partial [Ectocarpus sp. 13 AM-2016]
SSIDLSALDTIDSTGGDVLFQADNGRLTFTDFTAQADTELSATNTGEVRLLGDFRNSLADEASVELTTGVMTARGQSPQTIEIGGENLGVDQAIDGNFGVGQLQIGAIGQRSIVRLEDRTDNGNRGGVAGTTESLYLFGLGNEDGLLLRGDSVLILSHLDVYAYDFSVNEQVSLRSLFDNGVERLVFSDGVIQLEELPG